MLMSLLLVTGCWVENGVAMLKCCFSVSMLQAMPFESLTQDLYAMIQMLLCWECEQLFIF